MKEQENKIKRINLPIRPTANPLTPSKKNDLFSHPIKVAMKGIIILVNTSIPPRTDINVATCNFVKPYSPSINGVKRAKFNSVKLANVIPNMRFT